MNDTTQVNRRVNWFWTGYAVPAEPNQGLAFAKGSSDTMLDAAAFVTERAPWLRCIDAMAGGGVVPDETTLEFDAVTLTERGMWFGCKTATDLLRRAGAELHDELPHIVPLRAGLGILYASGPEPDVEQWFELVSMARMQTSGLADAETL
jgi:hypothetical protein